MKLLFLIGLIIITASCADSRSIGLWEDAENKLSCNEIVHLNMINKIGDIGNGCDVYHARTVITDMPAPRGNNYILLRSNNIFINPEINCSDEARVEVNVIYPFGNNLDYYIYENGSLKHIIDDQK